MANPFDQFDSSGNVFDQFDGGGGAQGTVTVGPLEDVRMGEQPQTPADYGAQIGGEPQLSPDVLAAAQKDSMAGRLATAVQHNVEPFIQHPFKSAYDMVVPNSQDLANIMALGKAKTYEQNLPIGSQEWLDQVVGYGAPLLAMGAGKVLGGARVAPEAPVREPGIPENASEAPNGVETAPPAPEGAKVAAAEPAQNAFDQFDAANAEASRFGDAYANVKRAREVIEPPPETEQIPSAASVEKIKSDDFGGETTPVSAAIINDLGGIMSRSSAIKAGKYNGAPELWDTVPDLASPTHSKIYNPTGQMPDLAAAELYDMGLIQDPSVDTMYNAIKQESQSAQNSLKSQRAQALEAAKAENAQRKAAVQDKIATTAFNKEAGQQPLDVPQGMAKVLPRQDELPTTGEGAMPGETVDIQAQSGQRNPAPVGESGVGRVSAGSGEQIGEPSSTKNAYTDEARARLGFPEATAEAARDFGKVWQEAEETSRRDPGAGARLVEAINDGKTKAVNDHDNALLLREQIRAQGEHTDAVAAVNEAKTPEDLTAAKARLVVARDSLQSVYEADKKAGRSTAQGLNARKMLANEDYSLAQMEARKRAANDGRPLNARQLQDVQALHEKIAELSDKVDQLQKSRYSRSGASKEAKTAAASGRRFTDFMDEQANKARARLISKRGRLNAGIDPTNLVDEAIIGASHIAKGLTKFSDWSAQMVKDFGERISPFLRELWNRATAIHNESVKRFKTTQERNLSSYKTRMANEAVGVRAKIERGDFTKPSRSPLVLDKAAFQMKANLERLKNEFERGVAKDAYKHTSKADKFWQHFVGIERAMKLSSPAVFEKLGLAAAAREVLAPAESAVGYGASKFFPKLAKGTRYGADLKTITRAEVKAKASLFTQGMRDAWENVKGKETDLEAMSDKYGRQPDFWYNRIGKIHAAVKAPIKRAEFVRSLEHRIDAAAKSGEDINHPEVMDRLATESALDANRAIFQQNTVVSKFFSMLDKASPAGGRVARFLFPVVKIPVNLFKELVTYNAGAPVAAVKIGRAYWKGVETLEPAAREAIIRQLSKGAVGGAALLWGYYNSDKAHDFFKSMPSWFEHTPIAMAIHEGSIVHRLEQQGTGTHYRPTDAMKEAKYAAKTGIPFAYTITDATDVLEPDGWRKYLYSMIQSSTVPQASSYVAKEMDKQTPFSLTEKPRYRPPQNIEQAIEQGIPGLRQQVPAKH